MIEFLPAIFLWWICIFFLGFISYPILFLFYKSHNGNGIFFAKIFGIFLLSYISWILSRLHILSFSRFNIIIILLIITCLSIYISVKNFQEIFEWRKKNYRIILANELVFLIVFIIFIFIRAYNSNIFGEEKFMDLAFINSICKTGYFPPPDPWLSGYTINYYYLSYIFNALIIKLTGLPVAIGYNLAIASTMALTFIGAWGVVYGLCGNHFAGIMSSILLVFSGNNDGLAQLIKNRGFQGFDYFSSSRVIPDTIGEFPFFSFLVGDLHPHFASLPLYLLSLSVCLTWYKDVFIKKTGLTLKEMLPLIFFTALIVGSLFAFNFWNVPSCFLLIFAAFIFSRFIPGEHKEGTNNKTILLSLILTLVISVIIPLPFFIDFHSPLPLKIMLVPPGQRTGIYPFLIYFAIFLFMSIFTLFFDIKTMILKLKNEYRLCFLYGTIIFFVVFYCAFESITVPILWFLIISIYLAAEHNIQKNNYSNVWPLYLFFIAYLIILGCEIFYLHDTYGHPYERMNTIFKFHYQAIVLLCLASGGVLYNIFQKKSSAFFYIAFFVLLSFTIIYPIGACYVKMSRKAPQLDGMKSYMEAEHRSDYLAINWLKENAGNFPNTPVIIEATGDPYTYFARVSANTGISAVLGWANHEYVWRGTKQNVAERLEDVKNLYETTDINIAKNIINKYGVTHVYWGELEQATYSPNGFSKFSQFMDIIYEKEGTVIFQVKSGK